MQLMANPVGLGCLEEFRERAIQHIRSEDWRASVEELFTRFSHERARSLIANTNKFPGDDLHYMKEKGAIGVAVNAAAILHHFSELASNGYLVCEYDLWGRKEVDASRGERVFDIGFLRPTGRNSSVMFNIETKNYENVTAPTLKGLSKQILYDLYRLKPKGDLKPIVPVWTFMQGLRQDARHDLEVKGFRVIDFTKARLSIEMKNALTP
jgi:hypothetical protein